MEFDWLDVNFDLKKVTPKDIEEAFEDPFALKLLPESYGDQEEARYILVGRAVSGSILLCVFWTDGKKFRVISAREATTNEAALYERKCAESL